MQSRFVSLGLMILIGLLPFHTLFVVWATRTFGNVYIWSAWEQVVLASVATAGLLLFVKDTKLRRALAAQPVNWLVAAYLLLTLLYLVLAKDYAKALVGLVFNTRFLLAFVLAQIAVYYVPSFAGKIKKLILLTGLAVAALAWVLHFLPADLLTHVGYDKPGVNTFGIPPAYHLVAGEGSPVRAQATLRGPNVFGAFLILPAVGFMFMLFSKNRSATSKRAVWPLSLIVMGVVLSHSRSAWMGAMLAAGLVGFYVTKRQHLALWASLFVVSAALAGSAVLARQNQLVKEVIFHESTNQSARRQESNQAHLENSKAAAADARRNPFGSGLGTAGPVSSIDGQAKVAENYFLQIFQEIGILGVGLFVAIQIALAASLWRLRQNQNAQIALVVLAGLTLTNMFLHTWADEVVAISFWGFAGAVLGSAIIKPTRKQT